MDDTEIVQFHKDTLNCIICFEVCKRAMISSCCQTLVCYLCSKKILETKEKSCPNCRCEDIQFTDSLPVQNIIRNMIVKCPLDDCDKTMINADVLSHLQSLHQTDERSTPLIDSLTQVEEKKQYESQVCFPIHRHFLTLGSSSKEYKCHAYLFLKSLGDCLRIVKPGDRFFYCTSCNYLFCLNCLEKEQVKFMNKYHKCPLLLTYKEGTWTCSGTRMPEKCRSEKSTYFTADKVMRYRCGACEFNVCGNCYDYYN